MVMELAGRVALVTGGATGIGRATVLHLAKSGTAGVVINYRTAKEQAEQIAAEARSAARGLQFRSYQRHRVW
jgi:NAD(P)-dependent dehydrogenase (short-subunit alcohol dehydrogenase family)